MERKPRLSRANYPSSPFLVFIHPLPPPRSLSHSASPFIASDRLVCFYVSHPPCRFRRRRILHFVRRKSSTMNFGDLRESITFVCVFEISCTVAISAMISKPKRTSNKLKSNFKFWRRQFCFYLALYKTRSI